jgi:Tfp pilus assembly protein PilF
MAAMVGSGADSRRGIILMKKTTSQLEAKTPQRRIKGLAIGVVSLALLAGCSANSSGQYLTNKGEARGVMISLARASDELGDYARAADYYAKAIAQGNASEQAWTRRGELLLQLGAVKSAQAHYEAALRAGMDTGDIHRGYARSLARTNQPEKALQQFDIALQKAPGSVKAMNGRGVALDMMGRHLEAQAQYAQAQEFSPTDLSVQNNLALSYTLAGNAHSAIAMLEDIYLSGSSNQQHRQDLALLYGLTGQSDKASALSHMDLRPELVGKNMAAYATLRQNYTAKVTEDNAAQSVAMASAASPARDDTPPKQAASAFSYVVLPPATDLSAAPLHVPEASYVAPKTMAMVKLPEPVAEMPAAMVGDVKVALLPLSPEVPEALVATPVDPIEPIVMAVVTEPVVAPSQMVSNEAEQQIQSVQVANLPLMAVAPTRVRTTAKRANGNAGIRPVIQIGQVFHNALAEAPSMPVPMSVVRRPVPQKDMPTKVSLSDIELFAMRAELDAFGNPMHILPAGPVKRYRPGSGPQARLEGRQLVPWQFKQGS